MIKHERVANSLPFVMFIILLGWSLYLAWRPLHVPVGTYIGVLAFVAAIVSIIPPCNAWSKAICFLLFGGFLVLEITTLYHQRSEDLETDRIKRIEEDTRFAGLLKEQEGNFAGVLKQNQSDFSATMREVQGDPGYVSFFAVARDSGPLPVMMENLNKGPIRGVDLEIINDLPLPGCEADTTLEDLQKYRDNMLSARSVHIGDVNPGLIAAPFTLLPGRYEIRIMTRLRTFDEHLEAIRGSAVPGGWHEEWCLIGAAPTQVLAGKCDDYLATRTCKRP